MHKTTRKAEVLKVLIKIQKYQKHNKSKETSNAELNTKLKSGSLKEF